MNYRNLSVAPVDLVVTAATAFCWNESLEQPARRLRPFPHARTLLLLRLPYKTDGGSIYICLQKKSVGKNKSVVLIDFLSLKDREKNLSFC
jgi:hypothetical protein